VLSVDPIPAHVPTGEEISVRVRIRREAPWDRYVVRVIERSSRVRLFTPETFEMGRGESAVIRLTSLESGDARVRLEALPKGGAP
jgi:hypothetical protein